MSSHVTGQRIPHLPPRMQTTASLSQATPTQNQWYTVLDTTYGVRLMGIGFEVATTGETLEVRVTIDGQTITCSKACSAGTDYMVFPAMSYTNGLFMDSTDSGTNTRIYEGFLFDGLSVKVEIRKTTASGTGTISAKVAYALW